MNAYEKVKEFHDKFAPSHNLTPKALDPDHAVFRSMFKIEEIIEFLYAASNGNNELFFQMAEKIKSSVDDSVNKINSQHKSSDSPLVGEVDALIDLLYFTYGSFVLMGVNPAPIFDIVHQANMGKLFPDGKPHYDPNTNKVLKPADWEKNYAPEKKILHELELQKKASECTT